MTKKHFIALADAIRDYNAYVADLPVTSLRRMDPNYRIDGMIDALADFCASQNSQFNRQRWLAYIAGECGPNGGKR